MFLAGTSSKQQACPPRNISVTAFLRFLVQFWGEITICCTQRETPLLALRSKLPSRKEKCFQTAWQGRLIYTLFCLQPHTLTNSPHIGSRLLHCCLPSPTYWCLYLLHKFTRLEHDTAIIYIILLAIPLLYMVVLIA